MVPPGDESKMPEPVGEDRRVTFYYEHDPGYRLVPANGAWIGITPRGDIRVDFFVEAWGAPEHVVNLLTPSGELGPELARSPATRITRRMQVGVLLSLEQADSTADFIKAKIGEFRKRQEGSGKPEE